ncbi:hypothetical protein CR513_28835, partial [Mucuna pruriens]
MKTMLDDKLLALLLLTSLLDRRDMVWLTRRVRTKLWLWRHGERNQCRDFQRYKTLASQEEG